MSLVVVAKMTPQPGKLSQLLAAFEQVTPAIHREPGCELYAVYTDEEVLVTIERWTDQGALDTHLKGEAVQQLLASAGQLLAAEPEIRALQGAGFGSEDKNTI